MNKMTQCERDAQLGITAQESTDIYQSCIGNLSKINYTHIFSKEEKVKLIKSARFIDIRVRVDGREYYFEGDFIKNYFTKKAESAYGTNQALMTTPSNEPSVNKVLPEYENKKSDNEK